MAATKLSWYALRVQSRLVLVASATLRGKGYEEFLPTYRSRHRGADRLKELDAPLFPGYLFCRFDPQDRAIPIVTTPGVIGFVGAGKTPLPIADEEIETVRSVVQSGLAPQPWPFLMPGSQLYIERGPLAGLQGTVVEAVGRQ
jgi:transcription antitermination factor NusG